MARFDRMIPFIISCEEPVKKEWLKLPIDQLFLRAKQLGPHNIPGDCGGWTSVGVTLATYKDYRRMNGHVVTTVGDLKKMGFNEWKAILKGMFWDRWKADQIASDMVACALVDWAWVSGAWGIKKPQELLGVAVDGMVGPMTLEAVNGYPDQRELFERIQQARRDYHVSIAKGAKAKFLRGWQNRVDRIRWEGFRF